MRRHIAEAQIEEVRDDELLTTGEAARILNFSRQHVVDLCNRGDLPFTTVGTHRRIRRSDVEALADRTLRLSRDQRRSLWLSYAIAGRLVAAPEDVLDVARSNLEGMRKSARGRARSWLNEWDRLLDGTESGSSRRYVQSISIRKGPEAELAFCRSPERGGTC